MPCTLSFTDRTRGQRVVSNFSWDDLRYFLAVARTGQLSAAARQMRTNHVTVSRRIDRLERTLAIRLFERSPKGYVLTTAGGRLVARAKAMEREAGLVGETGANGKVLPRGVVRLSAPEGFGNFFLGERLPAFAHEHPGLSIEFVTIQQIVSLSRREADIAVSLNPPANGPYRQEEIARYRLFLYASRTYLEASGPIESRAAVTGHPLVGYIDDMIFSPGLDYLRDILPGMRASYQSSSIQAQLSAGKAGYGLCILPHFIACRHGDLVPILPRTLHLERTYWLILHEELAQAPRIKVVAEFLRAQARAFEPTFRGDALLSGEGTF